MPHRFTQLHPIVGRRAFVASLDAIRVVNVSWSADCTHRTPTQVGKPRTALSNFRVHCTQLLGVSCWRRVQSGVCQEAVLSRSRGRCMTVEQRHSQRPFRRKLDGLGHLGRRVGNFGGGVMFRVRRRLPGYKAPSSPVSTADLAAQPSECAPLASSPSMTHKQPEQLG